MEPAPWGGQECSWDSELTSEQQVKRLRAETLRLPSCIPGRQRELAMGAAPLHHHNVPGLGLRNVTKAVMEACARLYIGACCCSLAGTGQHRQ